MQSILKEFDFCVVDLETTGLNPENDSGIIEVGGVKISGGSLRESYGQLADPGHPVPENITQILSLIHI